MIYNFGLNTNHVNERLDFVTTSDYNYDQGIKINHGIEAQEEQ